MPKISDMALLIHQTKPKPSGFSQSSWLLSIEITGEFIMYRKPLTPFRQGCLDSLCGVMSCINAISLALEQEHCLKKADYQSLFNTIIDDLGERELLTWIVQNGLGIHVMLSLIRLADSWLKETKGWRLKYHRPWVRHANTPALPIMYDEIKAHATKPSSAVILCISQPMDHWSVIRSIGENNKAALFDSAGYRTLSLSLDPNNTSNALIPFGTIFITAYRA